MASLGWTSSLSHIPSPYITTTLSTIYHSHPKTYSSLGDYKDSYHSHSVPYSTAGDYSDVFRTHTPSHFKGDLYFSSLSPPRERSKSQTRLLASTYSSPTNTHWNSKFSSPRQTEPRGVFSLTNQIRSRDISPSRYSSLNSPLTQPSSIRLRGEKRHSSYWSNNDSDNFQARWSPSGYYLEQQGGTFSNVSPTRSTYGADTYTPSSSLYKQYSRSSLVYEGYEPQLTHDQVSYRSVSYIPSLIRERSPPRTAPQAASSQSTVESKDDYIRAKSQPIGPDQYDPNQATNMESASPESRASSMKAKLPFTPVLEAPYIQNVIRMNRWPYETSHQATQAPSNMWASSTNPNPALNGPYGRAFGHMNHLDPSMRTNYSLDRSNPNLDCMSHVSRGMEMGYDKAYVPSVRFTKIAQEQIKEEGIYDIEVNTDEQSSVSNRLNRTQSGGDQTAAQLNKTQAPLIQKENQYTETPDHSIQTSENSIQTTEQTIQTPGRFEFTKDRLNQTPAHFDDQSDASNRVPDYLNDASERFIETPNRFSQASDRLYQTANSLNQTPIYFNEVQDSLIQTNDGMYQRVDSLNQTPQSFNETHDRVNQTPARFTEMVKDRSTSVARDVPYNQTETTSARRPKAPPEYRDVAIGMQDSTVWAVDGKTYDELGQRSAKVPPEKVRASGGDQWQGKQYAGQAAPKRRAAKSKPRQKKREVHSGRWEPVPYGGSGPPSTRIMKSKEKRQDGNLWTRTTRSLRESPDGSRTLMIETAYEGLIAPKENEKTQDGWTEFDGPRRDSAPMVRQVRAKTRSTQTSDEDELEMVSAIEYKRAHGHPEYIPDNGQQGSDSEDWVGYPERQGSWVTAVESLSHMEEPATTSGFEWSEFFSFGSMANAMRGVKATSSDSECSI